MLIDGAAADPEVSKSLERTCILFDGNAEDAVEVARGQWRQLTDAGCKAEYWSQADGAWSKKAEA